MASEANAPTTDNPGAKQPVKPRSHKSTTKKTAGKQPQQPQAPASVPDRVPLSLAERQSLNSAYAEIDRLHSQTEASRTVPNALIQHFCLAHKLPDGFNWTPSDDRTALVRGAERAMIAAG